MIEAGLWILFVGGIPGFAEQRRATLPLFYRLANLPKDTLKKYMRPEIFHSQGWSHGVEQFHGKYDTGKGSYYVNCVQDDPVPLTIEQEQHFTAEERKMFTSNRWVEDIPEM